MRLFVAVTLDAGVREEVGVVIRELARARAFESTSVKWVRPANLHLTLQFLGEVGRGRIEDITAALRKAWRQGRFHASLTDVGAFPPTGRPRVVWLGVGEGAAGCELFMRRSRSVSNRWGSRPSGGRIAPT